MEPGNPAGAREYVRGVVENALVERTLTSWTFTAIVDTAIDDLD